MATAKERSLVGSRKARASVGMQLKPKLGKQRQRQQQMQRQRLPPFQKRGGWGAPKQKGETERRIQRQRRRRKQRQRRARRLRSDAIRAALRYGIDAPELLWGGVREG